jgi:hypothetical protein
VCYYKKIAKEGLRNFEELYKKTSRGFNIVEVVSLSLDLPRIVNDEQKQ